MPTMRRLFGGSGTLWKPKNPHSLEYLRYLHGVLLKNEKVTEQNRSLLVEALRSISEILIWGDQNDPTVFDFFLEKNMLCYFLQIMKQKCGSYVCVQLLQTLNILFENIRHATSLYYLLSNNHVNSIITHRFDFSDEEIMAYYISFLKTLSLKLNTNTIHFFFNEQTNDFPLYTEAIKFFNHSESMVRIAVRTLTLNVYRVDDAAMLKFIRDKTAAPYFSNLVWFIGNNIMEINTLATTSNPDGNEKDRLSDSVAEHLDHVHYVNDILCLNIDALNQVLTDQLLKRLFLPLYLASLAPHLHPSSPKVSKVVALFLLSQVFLIITHQPLVAQLLSLLLFGDETDLLAAHHTMIKSQSSEIYEVLTVDSELEGASAEQSSSFSECTEDEQSTLNRTDEQKLQDVSSDSMPSAASPIITIASTTQRKAVSLHCANRPLFASFLNCFDCSKSDHEAFFALCLLYAIEQNTGIPANLLEAAQLSTSTSSNSALATDRDVLQKLVNIIRDSAIRDSAVRLITLELCCIVLRQLILAGEICSFQQDDFYAQIIDAEEVITQQMRHFYKAEDMFLNFFEDEYEKSQRQDVKVHMVSTEAIMLLQPSNTPLSGVAFKKRLPSGQQEQTRKVSRVFFTIRQLVKDLDGVSENRLPLSNPSDCVFLNDCLNLTNSDLLSCTVAMKNGSKAQRFLVTDGLQLILVEPDNKRLGWGVVRFVGFLQDIDISGDKEDSRGLQVTVHPVSESVAAMPPTQMTAKFLFDDHIRCMAAKQRLTKGRQKARQYKMDMIADLLNIPKRHAMSNSAHCSARSSPLVFRSLKSWNGKAPGGASLSTSAASESSHYPQTSESNESQKSKAESCSSAEGAEKSKCTEECSSAESADNEVISNAVAVSLAPDLSTEQDPTVSSASNDSLSRRKHRSFSDSKEVGPAVSLLTSPQDSLVVNNVLVSAAVLSLADSTTTTALQPTADSKDCDLTETGSTTPTKGSISDENEKALVTDDFLSNESHMSRSVSLKCFSNQHPTLTHSKHKRGSIQDV